MRIYEGSPRQDFEEVFRSIGAFLDQRGMKDVLLLEAPDGFIVQGLVSPAPTSARWSDSIGTQTKETLTFLDDDIARFMEEAARAAAVEREPRRTWPATTRRRSASSAATWTTRSRATSSSSSRTARSSSGC